MTKPEPLPRRETMADIQRLLARARPDQLRRLMADIKAVEMHEDADDRPQRRTA